MARGQSGALLALIFWSMPALALPPPAPESALDQLLARGDAALARGDSISALAYYRDAVNRAPRNPRGYVAVGRGYLAVHEPTHALEAFEAGQRNTRGSEELSLGLSQTYALQGDEARALRVLRELMSQGAHSLLLFETQAALAEHAGALTEALAARRAQLALLEAQEPVDMEGLHQARIRVAALQLLLGPADRLSSAHCGDPDDGAFLAALRGCR